MPSSGMRAFPLAPETSLENWTWTVGTVRREGDAVAERARRGRARMRLLSILRVVVVGIFVWCWLVGMKKLRIDEMKMK